MKFCPYCGKDLNAGDRFCQECGAMLEEAPVSENPADNMPESENKNHPDARRCAQCGMLAPAEDTFCQECGAGLSGEQPANDVQQPVAEVPGALVEEEPLHLFCAQCGAAMQSDDLFCPDCGAPKQDDAPAEETSQPAAIITPPPPQAAKVESTNAGEGSRKRLILLIALPVLLAVAFALWFFVFRTPDSEPKASAERIATTETTAVAEAKPADIAETPAASPEPQPARPETAQQQPSASPAPKTTASGQPKASGSTAKTTPQQETSTAKAGDSKTASKPAPAAPAKAKAVVIFSNWNDLPVKSNPSRAVRFQIDTAYLITSITTKHYNDGKGVKSGGTISIADDKRNVYGPWTCETKADKAGTSDAIMICHPNVVLPAGKYKLVNSEEKTWSFNNESGKRGLAVIEGKVVK